MQHRYFGKYASYYLFSVAYHKIPLAHLTLLASRINAPQQQGKYNTLENDCFNLLTVDPIPSHDLKYFSLILRLENTVEL